MQQLTNSSEDNANVISFTSPIGKQAKDLQEAFADAWHAVEPFDVDKRINLLQNVRIYDLGMLHAVEELGEKVKSIVESQKISFMLSYAHLSTLFALQQLQDIKLVVFDAHADCNAGYIDERIEDLDFFHGKKVSENFNDANWLFNYAKEKEGEKVFLIGLRSFNKMEMEFMNEKKIAYVTANDVKQKIEVVRSAIWNFTEGSNVYVSLDIDVFDPSIAPAVHYPEPNGIFFNHFQQIVQDLNGQLVGVDLCCLKPMKENKVTEFLAVRSIFEILSKVKTQIL
jgi:agmatinase